MPTWDVAHLFDSGGRWIAWYRPGLPYLWSAGNRWIGWFPWATEHGTELRGDAVDPWGDYLGTVVGNRLLRRTYRLPVALPRRVPEPQLPPGPPDVERTEPRSLPPGFVDLPAGPFRGG